MKTKQLAIPMAMAIAMFATVTVANADMAVTTKTTTYSGTVSEINPGSSTMILKSETSPTPVTYSFTPQTVFVDSAGNTVTVDAIRSKPVNVEYITEGDKTVVRKVTVINK
ncbi:MAG TPA: hypothetical protein VEL28_10770 [Candidatus Binatia bacterium]|nr:hypothetical protein [Candidatus Binatia bacterium]